MLRHEEIRIKKTRENKRREAKEVGEVRGKRSSKEQIAILDKRLGKGVGAKKERARLNKTIAVAATT